jgi:hypothetical protein
VEYFAHLRRIGVKVNFIVYDMLPAVLPQFFPGEFQETFTQWLSLVSQGDKVSCVSRAVADEFFDWLTVFGKHRLRPLEIAWFHPGLSATPGFGKDAPHTISEIVASASTCPTFLMVGSIESWRGYAQTLGAFERLWRDDVNVRLIIAGTPGKMADSIKQELRNHQEAHRRLFWMESLSEPQLIELYRSSTCLILASEGEGYSFTIREAAKNNLPIIARDIPIFRELAEAQAFYFSGSSASALAEALLEWLDIRLNNPNPQSALIPELTADESIRQLLGCVIGDRYYKKWMPNSVRRFWGSDYRLQTQVGRRVGRNMVSAGFAGCLIHGPYIDVEPGTYQVSISGKIGESGFAGAEIDVAVDKGTRILNRVSIHKPTASAHLSSFNFFLSEPAEDLEIRVWVNGQSEVTISSLEIQPATHVTRNSECRAGAAYP